MFLRVAVITKIKESHKHHGSCMLNDRKKKEGEFKKTESARKKRKRRTKDKEMNGEKTREGANLAVW
jgi:hypothetical protein